MREAVYRFLSGLLLVLYVRRYVMRQCFTGVCSILTPFIIEIHLVYHYYMIFRIFTFLLCLSHLYKTQAALAFDASIVIIIIASLLLLSSSALS